MLKVHLQEWHWHAHNTKKFTYYETSDRIGEIVNEVGNLWQKRF